MLTAAGRAGVTASRRPPYDGIWAGDEKLGAIGVTVVRGVTQGRVAIDVTTDLRARGWTPRRLARALAVGLADALGLQLAPANQQLLDVTTPCAAPPHEHGRV